MALRTVVAEIARYVIRICCLLEIRLMALVTILIHYLVITTYVACLALLRHMCTCQREVRCIVVKCRRAPRGGCMTLRAIVVEIPGNVIRVCRLLEIRLMTLVTILVHKLVVTIGMTILASNSLMSACQWELCCAMVERRWLPRCGGMTLCAIMVEVSSHVIRIRRLLEIRLMALVAILIHYLVIAANVTCLALLRNMCTGQWEVRRAVIERTSLPTRC